MRGRRDDYSRSKVTDESRKGFSSALMLNWPAPTATHPTKQLRSKPKKLPQLLEFACVVNVWSIKE